MMKTIRKAIHLGMKAMRMTKQQIQKEVDSLQKSGLLTPTEARELTTRIVKEAWKEQTKIASFLLREAEAETRKAMPLLRKATRRTAGVAGHITKKLVGQKKVGKKRRR